MRDGSAVLWLGVQTRLSKYICGSSVDFGFYGVARKRPNIEQFLDNSSEYLILPPAFITSRGVQTAEQGVSGRAQFFGSKFGILYKPRQARPWVTNIVYGLP